MRIKKVFNSTFFQPFLTGSIVGVFFLVVYFVANQTLGDRVSVPAIVEKIPEAIWNAPTPTPTQNWLSTRGNRVVDDKGREIVLRGVNVAGVNWGEKNERWNPKAVRFAIKEWDAQVIRTRVFQDPYNIDSEGTIASLERQVITPARKEGAYVILHPWIHDNDPLPDEGTIKMWRDIATRYRNDPTILYDVLPEPHNVSRQAVRRGYIEIIEAVRSVHPRSLIFVTGLVWGREINSYLEDPLPYPNIVYRSNPYNRAGEFESLFGVIARVYPVFLGEFGADAYPPMTKGDVRDLLAYADWLGLGWTAWNFHSVGCPCLLSDHESFTPSAYGQIIYDGLQKHALQDSSYLARAPGQVTSTVSDDYFVVYEDSLQNGFLDESWGTRVNLVARDQVFSGKHAIKAQFLRPSASIVLQAFLPVDGSDYSYLGFFLNWGDQEPFPLTVGVDNAAGQTLARVDISSYAKALDEDWYEVKIPLSALRVGNEQIGKVFFDNQSGERKEAIYLDEIEFTR